MTVPVSTTCLHVQHASAFQYSGVPGIFWVSPSHAQPLRTAHYTHGIFWISPLHAQPLPTAHYTHWVFWISPLHAQPLPTAHYIHGIFRLFILFDFFPHAQPLLTVHYITLGFSECHLHMQSHYQMCTIFAGFSEFSGGFCFCFLEIRNHYQLHIIFMGLSEFLLHMPSHYRMCLLYSWDFLSFSFAFTITTKCAL